jgi:hypothetical protein
MEDKNGSYDLAVPTSYGRGTVVNRDTAAISGDKNCMVCQPDDLPIPKRMSDGVFDYTTVVFPHQNQHFIDELSRRGLARPPA